MSNTIDVTLYGEDAKRLMKRLGLIGVVGETKNLYTRVSITVAEAAGRNKVRLEFDL